MQPQPKINIGEYRESTYYAEKRPISGVGFGSSKTDVQIKKKEPAKPKHGIIIGAVVIAGIFYLSTQLDERLWLTDTSRLTINILHLCLE